VPLKALDSSIIGLRYLLSIDVRNKHGYDEYLLSIRILR